MRLAKIAGALALATASVISAGPAAIAASPGSPIAFTAGLNKDATDLAANQDEALDRFWTPERRAQADANGDRLLTAGVDGAKKAPSPGQPVRIDPAPAQQPAAGQAGFAVAGSSAQKYTGPQMSPPSSTTGKVHFVTDLNETGTCSASVVSSESDSLLFTAAHCVHGGKNRAKFSNWQFYPAVKGGFQSSLGEWSAKKFYVPAGWTSNSFAAYDYAAVILNPKGAQKIQPLSGAQGITWNHSKSLPMFIFGYPAAPPFDGNDLYYCSGTTSAAWYSSSILEVGCDMTGGASGGPWLMGYSGGLGWVNGVFSTGSNFLALAESPYFDSETGQLYNAARFG